MLGTNWMKCISISNPFAALIAKGYKTFETRSWPAPQSIIGQRIAIAATKNIVPGVRVILDQDDFLKYYSWFDMPDPLEMPAGCVVCTARLDSVELMTEEMLEEVSDAEKTFGHWQEGFYAWRLMDVEAFDRPIPIRGQQGLYDWNSDAQKIKEVGA